MQVPRFLVLAIALLVLIGAFSPAHPRLLALSSDSAPALPAPSGNVVTVSTVSALTAAVGSLTSNRTIVITPGTYNLTSTLWINGGFANVTIRGATNNRDDVVLVGRGMGVADANVPFGIWTGGGVTGLTIANLTIRDIYQHPIVFNGGTESPRVYNIRLINAGEQFLKANPDGAGGGVDNGIVEYSVFEYANTAPNDYTNGVDVHTGRDWIIRHNLFRRIRAPQGQLAGPAVLMWNGSSGTIAEANTFIDCHREISFGLIERTPNDHTGGIIRNNFIVRNAGMGGDVAIGVFDSPGTIVAHNSVLMNGQYPNVIEYRFPNTTGVSIVNNLGDRGAQARDGAVASLQGNVWTAAPGWFVGPAGGDLHLQSTASLAIDHGVTTSHAPTDWDGDSRSGGGPDVGADERVAGTPPPSSPPPPAPAPTPTPEPPAPQPPAPTPAPPATSPPAPSPAVVSPGADDQRTRRRRAQSASSGRAARPRPSAERSDAEGVVRRHQVALGIELWTIQSASDEFEIMGSGLDPVYRVEGLAVAFEGRVRADHTSVLEGARVLELRAIAPR